MSRALVRRPQQLPLVPEHRRAYVVDFARSALFGVGGKSDRVRFENKIVASWSDTKIEYSGTELRSDDQDVLLALLHRARGMEWDSKEGIQLEFSGNNLLLELEWPSTSDYYTKLRDCLNRLQGGSVAIVRSEDGRVRRERCQLIRKFVEKPVAGARFPRWHVWIEPEMAQMFGSEDRRYDFEWAHRRLLGKPIAKWLHSFLLTILVDPSEWVAVQEANLFYLTGSKATATRTIRALVKSGLEEMLAKRVIYDFVLHQGMVYVAFQEGLDRNRASAATQQRLLAFQGAPDVAALETA